MIEYMDGYLNLCGVCFRLPNGILLDTEEIEDDRIVLYSPNMTFRIIIEKNYYCMGSRTELELLLETPGYQLESSVTPIRCGELEGHQLEYRIDDECFLDMRFYLGGNMRAGATVLLQSTKDVRHVLKDPCTVTILESLKTSQYMPW